MSGEKCGVLVQCCVSAVSQKTSRTTHQTTTTTTPDDNDPHLYSIQSSAWQDIVLPDTRWCGLDLSVTQGVQIYIYRVRGVAEKL